MRLLDTIKSLAPIEMAVAVMGLTVLGSWSTAPAPRYHPSPAVVDAYRATVLGDDGTDRVPAADWR